VTLMRTIFRRASLRNSSRRAEHAQAEIPRLRTAAALSPARTARTNNILPYRLQPRPSSSASSLRVAAMGDWTPEWPRMAQKKIKSSILRIRASTYDVALVRTSLPSFTMPTKQ